MKKLLTIILILLLPVSLWAAGDGTVGDPYDCIDGAGCYEGEVDAGDCNSTVYISGNTSASPTEYTTNLNLAVTCTEGNELTVSVSNGTIEVLGGAKWTSGGITVSGEHQILRGFQISGGLQRVLFTGTNNRMTESYLSDLNGSGNGVGGVDVGQNLSDIQGTEIDHCTFEDVASWNGYMIRLNFKVGDESDSSIAIMADNGSNHIHHNLFKGHDSGGNYETIQIGRGTTSALLTGSNIVEYNYFDDCDSDNELISVKTSGNTIRYNVVNNSAGHFTIRNGDDNEIHSNFVYNDGEESFQYIARVHGSNNKVYNNYGQVASIGIQIEDGDAITPRMTGTIDTLTNTVLTDADGGFPDLSGHVLWIIQADGDYRWHPISSSTGTTITNGNSNIGMVDQGGAAGDTYIIANNMLPATNTLISHNTYYEVSAANTSKSRGLDTTTDNGAYPPSNNTVQNNLFWSDGQVDGNDCLVDTDDDIDDLSWIWNTNIAWDNTGGHCEWETAAGSTRPTDLYIESECTWVVGSSCDPGFTPSTDMYIPQVGYAAAGAGTYNDTVSVDIYGNDRSDTTPTIGAFEIGGQIPTPVEVGASWDGLAYTVPGRVEASPDTTPPTLSSATINADGDEIDFVFSDGSGSVTIGSGGSAGWALACTGGSAGITYSSGDPSLTFTYTIDRVIYESAEETCTISYTQPGDGIEDTSVNDNDLANITDDAVTNKSTIEVPPTVAKSGSGIGFGN